MFNDEEEDENAVGAVRYPCMPSLVSLQQMRNRLHLAYLGRKLMKWTALATGRELRRISAEIDAAYKSFADDLSNAFMLLARARYFYPNLNKMVLENCPHKASVVVVSSTKTVSGVKVIQYDIVESGQEPYEHLGIEKGGQKIHEAKLAWLELLKRMVLMLELRTSFTLIEQANKNATKKQNVLGRVVVPRTNASIHYINDELEEMAREEFFRLKKILEIKRRMYQIKCSHTTPVEDCKGCATKFKDMPIEEECPVCGHSVSSYPKIPTIPEEEVKLDKKNEKTDKSMLEVFRRNISDIIDLTEGIKGKGLAATSVDKFLKTASELKEKLGDPVTTKGEKTVKAGSSAADQVKVCKEEDHLEKISSNVSVHKLCDTCIKRFEDEQAAKGAQLDKNVEETKDEARLIIKKEQKTPVDLELGVFETEYQTITKIIRMKKEDGTITEERKVIKRKKETKMPVKPSQPRKDDDHDDGESIMYQLSGASSRSTPYPSNSKAIGIVLVKDRSILGRYKTFPHRNARSEMLVYVSSIACPVVRYCMSSTSMSTTSENIEYFSLTVGSREMEIESELTLKELHTSSSEYQDV